MTEDEIRKFRQTFLDIDPDNLDVECLIQPRLMRYWGRIAATARRRHAVAEKALKTLMAQVRNEYRAANPDAKVKEVDDAAETDSRVQKAWSEKIKAEYEVDLFDVNVKALASKDHRLSNLGELLRLGYWNNPRIDPETRDRYLGNKRLGLARKLDDEAARLASETQDSKPVTRRQPDGGKPPTAAGGTRPVPRRGP